MQKIVAMVQLLAAEQDIIQALADTYVYSRRSYHTEDGWYLLWLTRWTRQRTKERLHKFWNLRSRPHTASRLYELSPSRVKANGIRGLIRIIDILLERKDDGERYTTWCRRLTTHELSGQITGHSLVVLYCSGIMRFIILLKTTSEASEQTSTATPTFLNPAAYTPHCDSGAAWRLASLCYMILDTV